MPDASPETIGKGFSTAFRLSTPVWLPYNQGRAHRADEQAVMPFAEEVRRRQADRGIGGIEEYRVHIMSGHGASSGGQVRDGEPRPASAKALRSAWMGDASFEDPDRNAMLSAREARVQEALHGTWTRGFGGGKEVGLEGVEEFAEAKGESVGSLSDKWIRRHHD